MGFPYSLEFIRHRYNYLAAIYPVFEIVFALPRGIRAKAVERLDLREGDTVLEVECGTGRNLAHLVKAVGSSGRVYGVDCTEGMLRRARNLSRNKGWQNVVLLHQDAAEMLLPAPVDGVLFSLSYTVMPESQMALAQAWKYLRAHRHVVIMDGKMAHGWLGRLSQPLVTLLSKATVLGDLDRQPWEDLKDLTSQVEMEEVNFGTYYICRAKKDH